MRVGGLMDEAYILDIYIVWWPDNIKGSPEINNHEFKGWQLGIHSALFSHVDSGIH